MADGTYRVDATMVFDEQTDAEVAFGEMTSRLSAGLAEGGDSITITRDLQGGGVRVQGTMRFATKSPRDTLKMALVAAAVKAEGYRISTHLCKHIIGESCPKPTVIEGGDLGAS